MDAYEKLFIKLEAKRKQAEIEEARKELNSNTENKVTHSEQVQDHIKSPDVIEVEKTSPDKNADNKKSIINKEGEIETSANVEIRRNKLIPASSDKKPPINDKSRDKQCLQLKVFKFTNDSNTSKLIPVIETKEGQLINHVLAVDNNLDENIFKDEILLMIKKTGINYIIAPGFSEVFYRNACAEGLQLIRCSDSNLLEDGIDIEVHLNENFIYEIDNDQQHKFKLMSDYIRRSTIQKICFGESLQIGNNLKIKVLDINKDQIKLCVNALKVITLYLNKCSSIDEEIQIKVLTIYLDQATIVIEAPEDLIIKRDRS